MTYRIIHVDEEGNVEKITDRDGKEIVPHPIPQGRDTKDDRMIAMWHPASRCVYPRGGGCYC